MSEPTVEGQGQKPRSGSNPASTPAVKLVSGPHRSRSHSPRCRIDVDVVVSNQGRRRKERKAINSQEYLVVPSDWEATSPDDDVDDLLKSFPPSPWHRHVRPKLPFEELIHLQRSFSSQCLLSTVPTNLASSWNSPKSSVLR